MLSKITDDIWTATSSVRLLPGAHLPTRMTVVRRSSGLIWVHSPIELDDALAQQVLALGKVTTIVAPNCLHHLHVGEAARRFEGARVLAARGVEVKQPSLKIDGFLEDAASEFDDDLQSTFLEGAPKLGEWLFVHRASRTLIATDLIFNVREPKGALTPLVLTMAGTNKRVACSKILKTMVKDNVAFQRSVEQCLQGGIDRLVMSHGDVIEEEAEAQLRAAMTERFG